jgi:hypothetical protein
MKNSQIIATTAAIATLLAASAAAATVSSPPPPSDCAVIKRGVRGNVTDTFIWDLHPNHNEGAYIESFTGSSSSGGEKRALFGFDLSSIPEKSVVTSAKFYVMISSNFAKQVRAHRALAPWGEMTATWNNFGGIDPVVSASFMSGGYSKWVNMDLTGVVQSWVNGDLVNAGILLEEGTSSSTSYKTSDHSNLAYRPYLEVCYSEPQGSIGDTVWFDANADGLQDPGEQGISGVVLDLFADANCDGQADGAPISAAVTGIGGTYQFTTLAAGCYVVDVDESTVPPGHVLTSAEEPMAVTLGPGESYQDADFGYVTLSSIGDTVWLDSDADGVYDVGAGELGVNGVVVELRKNGVVIDTTVTGNSPYTGEPGFYLFHSLQPATYTVHVSAGNFDVGGALFGHEPTADLDGGFDNMAAVSLGSGVDFLDADFGYQMSCGNGTCQPGESCSSCSADCGACPPVCGNEDCEAGESCSSCSADCGACGPVCGDGACEPGEDCGSCAGDCGACAPVCGDEACEAGEDCSNCAGDCGACPAVCGNNACEAGEDCGNCSQDCGACPAVCGNDACEAGEDCSLCPSDCGLCPPVCGNNACELTETCSNCSQDCGACPPVCGDQGCNGGEDCASCSPDCGSCPIAPPGTGTQGYWKTHPNAWPVEQLTIGGVVYTKDQLITMMKHPTKKDVTYALVQQLIAAKLNVGVGNQSSCIESAIAQADAWLAQHPVGSNVSGGSAAWTVGQPLNNTLDAYNNGLLCAPHRD